MKALGAAIVVFVALYVADQVLTEGKYSSATQQMVVQIRHSTGI